MNKIFNSESDMQEWLSKQLKKETGLSDLIKNNDYLDNCKVSSLADKKVFESFEYCCKSLHINEILSENENISLNPKDSLKPDFLLYASETESIVIVELKNLVGPSRQAGTEISAYASEIKSYIPFISEGDVINVIISTEWTTLLKHYLFNEIFWLQKNIICLEPIIDNGVKKLKIIDIGILCDKNVALKLSPKHLGGFQICLYDYNLYSEPENRDLFDPHLEQMKTALSVIATKGYSQKNHGFAFLWRDTSPSSLAPYSITILNFAPFQSIERLFHDEEFEPNDMTEKLIDIIVNYCPEGHGKSLGAITDAGIEFLKNFCTPREEGYTTWDNLKSLMKGRCELIAFKCWGIFDELYMGRLLKEYQDGNSAVSSTDPNIGLAMLSEVIDTNYGFIDLSYYKYDPEKNEYFIGIVDKTNNKH